MDRRYLVTSSSGPATLKREKAICLQLFSVIRYIGLHAEGKCPEDQILENWLDDPNPDFGLLTNTEKNLKEFLKQYKAHYNEYKDTPIINAVRSITLGENSAKIKRAYREDTANCRIFSVDNFLETVMDKNDDGSLSLKSVEELDAHTAKAGVVEAVNEFEDMLKDYDPIVTAKTYPTA